MAELSHIRNFSIIAHIDTASRPSGSLHSALRRSVRERNGGSGARSMISSERGITIKAQSVTLNYQARDGKAYHELY